MLGLALVLRSASNSRNLSLSISSGVLVAHLMVEPYALLQLANRGPDVPCSRFDPSEPDASFGLARKVFHRLRSDDCFGEHIPGIVKVTCGAKRNANTASHRRLLSAVSEIPVLRCCLSVVHERTLVIVALICNNAVQLAEPSEVDRCSPRRQRGRGPQRLLGEAHIVPAQG